MWRNELNSSIESDRNIGISPGEWNIIYDRCEHGDVE